MDSWNLTDPEHLTDSEHLTDTESEEDGSGGLPPEDAGYEVDEVDVVVVDDMDVLVEGVEVDVKYEIAQAEAPFFDRGREGEQPLVDTAPAAPAPPSAPANPAGTTTPEASIDEVEAVLDQVDAALARLDDGTYGRCVNCGRPIQDDRLAEDPTDQSCGECVELALSGVD
jgi:RNA polymerase-binding transcription factor DksA